MTPHTQPSLRKAAILLASLDAETADRLLAQMPAEQADLLRRLREQLDEVESGEQSVVINEFLRVKPAAGAPVAGIDVIQISAPKPAPNPAQPFKFLREARGARLSTVLHQEHPQTIALVVSHLPEDQASDLLGSLSATTQIDVIRRLAVLDQTDPEILREVERGLKSRVTDLIHDEHCRAAGLTAVASILRAAEPRVRRAILANLAAQDRTLANKLGRREVLFSDLDHLDDDALRLVMTQSNPEVLRLAIAGSSPQLIGRIVKLLPPREGKALRKALDRWDPTRLSDVEEAQRQVAAVTEQLLAEGQIDLPGPTGRVLALAA
ncbi:MAG: hypothetical protein JSS27_03925 [Planctomycetes bacterium]|nr:hypothetical protein [Planctomycetota bacterium]